MKKILIACVLVAIAFTACKKTDNKPAPNKSIESNKKKLVVSYTINGSDGENVTNYEYDNQNRIIRSVSKKTGTDIDLSIRAYSYDEKGNLVKITDNYSNDPINITKYSYENNLPVSISYYVTANELLVHTDKVTIENGLISKLTDQTYTDMHIQYRYKDGNLMSRISAFTINNVANSNTTEYEYGINKNPFLHAAGNWKELYLPNKNEVTKLTHNEPDASKSFIQTLKYTYDEDGYPVTCETIETSNSTTTRTTAKILYKDIK